MSSKRVIEDLLALLGGGYVPYTGQVEGKIYERHRCPRPEKATWFTRGGRYLCLGCARRCVQAEGTGFQATLPGVRRGFQVAFALLPSITADELVQKKTLLNVNEAAFALCVSPSQVYLMISEGKLVRHEDSPVRVTSESVRKEMARVEE